MSNRSALIETAENTLYDVAIIGGGINGACLYDRLCSLGYRVLLLEKNDFASGTSQASGMMIWGGLLYLKNFDVKAVREFSMSRDAIINGKRNWVVPRSYHFLPARTGILSKIPTLFALYFYWVLSSFRRQRPSLRNHGNLPDYLKPANAMLAFEEGELRPSDSRFVLHWITRHPAKTSTPLNHAELTSGGYDASDKCWKLDVKDTLDERSLQISAKLVVNCAGIWTDSVNRQFAIETPYKHVFSKGAYLLFNRPADHVERLIFMMQDREDVITNLPWGPVEMWGPTEELITDLDQGFRVTRDDVSFLLDQRNGCFQAPRSAQDIVNVRCGVRPLPVPLDYDSTDDPIDLSRGVQVYTDPERPWISTYGGKLTGCLEAASKIEAAIGRRLNKTTSTVKPDNLADEDIQYSRFSALEEPVPSASWCRRNEYCHTLDSYLRRRTNIAQWVPRGGLGRQNEYVPELRNLSLDIHGGNHEKATEDLTNYQNMISGQFDPLFD